MRWPHEAASLSEAFAAALRATAAAEPAPASLLGLEHEYQVLCRDGPLDFRELIHSLTIDGLRLDPGDKHAYRTRQGLAVTSDGAEAEVASPPVALQPGFTSDIARWAEAGRRTLQRALPKPFTLAGYSTHLSAAMPHPLNDDACDLFARTFAPAFALVIERRDSQGVYVRPRPARMELCGEFVDGSRLRAAAALAAGGARACALAVEGHPPRAFPQQIEVELLPGIDRYGLRVRREAYGVDLYTAGRAGLLRRLSGGTITAQEQIELAWAAAEEALAAVAVRGDLADGRAIVRGTRPLGVEDESDRAMRHRAPSRSPFGDAIVPRCRRRLTVTPVLATWDVTVFRLDGASRSAFASIPRDALARFLRALDRGELDELLGAYLEASPGGRALNSHAQVGEPALYDVLGDPVGLVAEERLPAGATLAGTPAPDVRNLKGEPGLARIGKLAAPALPAGAPARSRTGRPNRSSPRRWSASARQVGSARVLSAVSGGVDSERGDRPGAARRRRPAGGGVCGYRPAAPGRAPAGGDGLPPHLGAQLVVADEIETFFDALQGVTEPEQKRRIIGETFIRIFEDQARRLGQPRFLVQGTIYPDVVESSAPDRSKAQRIKTHHNVGGLPKDMHFELVEPLRYLFKDEVRAVGEALGLPAELVWRQPFPGPGLAVRCLGELTLERLERLRAGGRHLHRRAGRGRAAQPAHGGRAGRHRPGLCRAAAGALGGRDGRPAHLPGSRGAAGGHHRRFHDRRLGPPPVRPAGAGRQPHRQRGQGGQPGGVRHHQQTAGHH